MTGRDEVRRQLDALQAAFDRLALVPTTAPGVSAAGLDELRSDVVRHLCVLVSGVLQKSTIELLLAHSTPRTRKTVVRYVAEQLKWFRNPLPGTLLDLLGNFDLELKEETKTFLAVDNRHTSVLSVVKLRNRIVHGEDVILGESDLRSYHEAVVEVIEFLLMKLDPPTKPRRRS